MKDYCESCYKEIEAGKGFPICDECLELMKEHSPSAYAMIREIEARAK